MKTSLTKLEAKKRLAQLRQTIDAYRYEYHVLDRQSISDAALDSLKHELTQLETLYPEYITSDSPSQRVAGKPLAGFTKVEHAQRMFSLADVFNDRELRDWDTRWRKLRPDAATKYLADLKLDGLAITLRYERGMFIQAATRGDGYIGEDVTQNVRTIEAVPLQLRTAELPPKILDRVSHGIVEIRGEIVMLKKDFLALNNRQTKLGLPVFANPRNVSAGSIRQLDPTIAASRKLRFYAWELLTDLGQQTLTEAYHLLKQLGLPVNPLFGTYQTIEELITFYQRMNKQRDSLPFWIDGMVIKLDDRQLYSQLGFVGKTPRAAVAWKFAAEQVTTVVEDIVVQVGRTGALTPVAHLRPVEVAGTTVSRATLHNADEVARLDVRLGDTVVIQKAGDIIPEIVQVVARLRPPQARTWNMVTVCPVCEEAVSRTAGEAIHYCLNRHCPARRREHLYHFVSRKALDIDGLGPSLIDTLVDENLVHEPADLFTLKVDQLVGLPFVAEKKAENIIAAIRARRRVPFDRFIFSLGIRHVGDETARTLAHQFGTLPKFITADEHTLRGVSDVGGVVAASISEFFADRQHRQSVERLARQVTIIPPTRPVGHSLQGKTFVVTGTLPTLSRDQAQQAIRQAGGKVTSSVSAKTNFVVVGDEPGSKATRAKELGVTMVNESELLTLIQKQ